VQVGTAQALEAALGNWLVVPDFTGRLGWQMAVEASTLLAQGMTSSLGTLIPIETAEAVRVIPFSLILCGFP
jgi:hypothetical protein